MHLVHSQHLTMVCGETVNVFHIIPQCLLVCSCAQHGPHLTTPTTNMTQVLVAQEEMMGANLTRDLHSLLLSSANDKHLVGVRNDREDARTCPNVIVSLRQ